MRVAMVSKALVVGAYQRKAEEIAACGVDLTVLIPPGWQDRRGRQTATRQHTAGYALEIIPLRLDGNFHLHHYPTLGRKLRELRPDIVHMDEEPYNLATWHGLSAAASAGAVATFFTWQNLYRRYPPPFCWFERSNYRRAPVAIAGNQAAAGVLRRKGYAGQVAVIPQFGVDPQVFHPRNAQVADPSRCTMGYAGGLLPEKGVDLLVRACAGLRGAWQLRIAGEGSERGRLQALAGELGVASQVEFSGRVDSQAMPDFYRTIDVLALPSRSTPSWQEQFGRVLVEAMACAVAVVGSDSGEIPQVLGAAGLVFPEDDVDALRAHLQDLLDNPDRRRALGEAGRRRVLEQYTMAHIARQTVDVYHELMNHRQKPTTDEHR
jgi:glycosyltransferase involved in cell wall biosynthesis